MKEEFQVSWKGNVEICCENEWPLAVSQEKCKSLDILRCAVPYRSFDSELQRWLSLMFPNTNEIFKLYSGGDWKVLKGGVRVTGIPFILTSPRVN